MQTVKGLIPGFAKDTRLNFSSIIGGQGSPGLDQIQAEGVLLSAALQLGFDPLADAVLSAGHLDDAEVAGVKSAVAIMGMNNIYYRTMHLLADKEVTSLPAKLRMNVIGSPPNEKLNFEIYSLGVSVLSGCGMCINAHVNELKKAGLSNEGVQSVIRLVSVVNSVFVSTKL